ncbi:MAG TPA: hypothetical protein VIJ94_15715 [Caulobacteraceae bacterium]
MARRTCRVCGCTQHNACMVSKTETNWIGPCSWVAEDLCSNPDCLKAAEAVFPRGQLNASDEGVTQIAVTTEDRTVIIRFNQPMIWLGLDADGAEGLAGLLLKHAKAIRDGHRN